LGQLTQFDLHILLHVAAIHTLNQHHGGLSVFRRKNYHIAAPLLLLTIFEQTRISNEIFLRFRFFA
jgi:hypothetical protein